MDQDDFRDFVSLPQKIPEELEPLKKDELRLIIENASTIRLRDLYWLIASTGARISEALQIRVKDIDFEKIPTLVTFSAKITKGKKQTRYHYLTKENTPLIRTICRDLSENDLVFTSTKILRNALSNKQHSLSILLENIKLNEKYVHNGHLKKTFHSMRSFVSSQIYNATIDSEFAHAYLGHDTYLNQYLRKSNEERASMFTVIEPELTIFEKIQQNNDDEKLRKVEKMLQIEHNEIAILKAEKQRMLA